MTQKEFSDQMSRLRGAFGERFFNAEKSRILFDRLSGLDYSAFYKGITRVISSENYAPTVDKIIEIFSTEIKEIREKEILSMMAGHSCIACNLTGAVIYINIKNRNSYAFKCHCRAGNILRPNYPIAPTSEKEFIFHTKFRKKTFYK